VKSSESEEGNRHAINPDIGGNFVLNHPPSRPVENHITLEGGNALELRSKSVVQPSIEWRALCDVGGVQLHEALDLCIRCARDVNGLDPFSELSIRPEEDQVKRISLGTAT